MTDHRQSQRVKNQKATEETLSSFRETSQTVVESLMSIQEGCLKLAQGLFLGSMEVLTYQLQSAQTLVGHWQQQSQEWQEGFRRPLSSPMQLYLDVFLAPLTLSHKLVEASMSAMQRERELVEAKETVRPQEQELAEPAAGNSRRGSSESQPVA